MIRPICKIAVQTLSLIAGLFGALFIAFSVFTAYTSLMSKDYVTVVLVSPISLLLGGVLITLAWQVVSAYSIKSIKSFSAIAVLFLLGNTIEYIDPMLASAGDQGKHQLVLLIGLTHIAAAFISYWLVVKVLVKLTLEPERSQ